jgi:hypothetical protein
MLPVSLVEVQDENDFQSAGFLAGLLPGNYGTLIAPPLDYTSPRFGALTLTYADLDAGHDERELIIYRQEPVYREETQRAPHGNLSVCRAAPYCSAPDSQR